MSTTNTYLTGLKQAFYDKGGKRVWDHFEEIKHGASTADLEKLQEIYPDVPQSLIELLNYVDGTYWRQYSDEEIALFILGSDLDEYPYYLNSCQQIIENQHIARNYYGDFIERKFPYVEVDRRVIDKAADLKWLHFSDCMNNGGTSQLFIDFSPSKLGKVGQIVRFVHDPDEFFVIASSFEDYLKMLINNKFDFVDRDDMN